MEDGPDGLMPSLSDDALWDVIQYMRILVREQDTQKIKKESA